jgi:hypothetical protein
VRFDRGITHTFERLDLAPGTRLVLAKNPAAFATRHETNGLTLVAWASGNLARGGETLSLMDPAGTNILTFSYSRLWHPETYNGAASLVAVDLAAPESDWSAAAQWRPSRVVHGTPGSPEPPLFTAVWLTPEQHLVMTAEGASAQAELWFSPDLEAWSPCDPDAWSLQDGVFTVDLEHPTLAGSARRFFQCRTAD